MVTMHAHMPPYDKTSLVKDNDFLQVRSSHPVNLEQHNHKYVYTDINYPSTLFLRKVVSAKQPIMYITQPITHEHSH